MIVTIQRQLCAVSDFNNVRRSWIAVNFVRVDVGRRIRAVEGYFSHICTFVTVKRFPCLDAHEPDAREIGRLLASVVANPDRTHLVGAYGLGKTQRIIALLRQSEGAK